METAFAVLLFLVPPALTIWILFGRRKSTPSISLEPAALDNRFWPLFFNAFRLRCPVCKRGKIFTGRFCGWNFVTTGGVRIGGLDQQLNVVVGPDAIGLARDFDGAGLTGGIEIVAYIGCRFGLGIPDTYLLPPLVAFAAIFPLYFFRYARSSWLVFDQYFQPRLPPQQPAA